MKMLEMWFCEFWNCQTNQKEYREYPVSFYRTQKEILKMIENRNFLLPTQGWQLTQLKKYDPNNNPFTELFGELIYKK
jgi:hypothetical protein